MPTAPPPTAPPAYIRQLALYAALLEQIYPDHQIVTWLVWTEATAVQEISESARMDALTALVSAAGA